MDDLIRRSDAIRIASGYCHWSNIPKELAKLPSVNPITCDDAISRKAVLDCLTATKLKKFDFILQAREEIKNLPSASTEKTGRWIPISEILPEKYGEYLVTWTTSQSKRPFIGISEGEITGEFDHEHSRFKFEWLLEDYIKIYPDVKVTAWMPLPQPYEPQESEE